MRRFLWLGKYCRGSEVIERVPALRVRFVRFLTVL
jgi:hypothetical protein